MRIPQHRPGSPPRCSGCNDTMTMVARWLTPVAGVPYVTMPCPRWTGGRRCGTPTAVVCVGEAVHYHQAPSFPELEREIEEAYGCHAT
jgi:hypothetical protein